ncbi:putative hydroxymethylpyrimidine transport system permease protein [Paenibacillus castaneae]|uniref:ABC transporter permease n=1 Tax=Paenibacillus castaneae TaxID=474957 RepID=UPI001FB9ADB2|nr:ABC transporter permease [Paenibacillus castaneae]NIK77249.1 putative hydroxymethylpyrimidine transport system permease protein [Paenibacillus castaneae]
MRKPPFKKWLNNYGLFVLLLMLILVAWEGIVRFGWVPAFIIPAPTSAATALIKDSHLLLGRHLLATLREVALGFLLSTAVGVALAIAMHSSRTLEKALYPFIVISQTIPLITLSPIFIMWFGYTIWSKVAVVFLTAFFPIIVSTYDGLRKSDKEYSELLLTMGASSWDIFCKIKIPMALPSFFSGLKLSIVYCVVGATIGEWLGGNEGLGYYTRRMSSNLKTDSMFASVMVLSLLGMLLFAAIVLLEKILLTRRGRTK